MIVKTFLFALLFSFFYLKNADAYLEKSPVNDIFQQGTISESELETLQEKIAEQKHPQQWRRWRRRGRFPRPYPPYPVYPPPIHSPYCSYHSLDIPYPLRSDLFTAICDGVTTRGAKNIIRRGGFSPHQTWVTGETPLMLAAQTGNFRLVKMLVEEFGVNWKRRDQWGHTAADWAYENGYDNIGDYLFYSSYCSHHRLPRYLRSRLFTAICDGATRSARNIIRRGNVSPHQPWVTGETPLMLAAQTGNFELVKMLVEEFDVDWKKRDKWGHTAADWAYENGYDNIGDYLCDL